MLLRKEKAGGVAGYDWPHDGAVVDVDPEIGLQLLKIGHAGFSEEAFVPEPEEAKEAVESEESETPVATEEDPSTTEEEPRRPRRERPAKTEE